MAPRGDFCNPHQPHRFLLLSGMGFWTFYTCTSPIGQLSYQHKVFLGISINIHKIQIVCHLCNAIAMISLLIDSNSIKIYAPDTVMLGCLRLTWLIYVLWPILVVNSLDCSLRPSQSVGDANDHAFWDAFPICTKKLCITPLSIFWSFVFVASF